MAWYRAPVCRYEPFWDLSLPLTREGKAGGISGWFSGKAAGAPSIQDCLQAFTADETMQARSAAAAAAQAMRGMHPKARAPATLLREQMMWAGSRKHPNVQSEAMDGVAWGQSTAACMPRQRTASLT